MLLQKGIKFSLGAVLSIVLLNGCSTVVFPDFEDDSEIIVHEGGRVEIREVKEKGILIGDKENASYEDDKTVNMEQAGLSEGQAIEKISPAKVVEVKSDEIVPVEDNVKIVETEAEIENRPETKEIEETEEDEIRTPNVHYLAATIYFENGGAVVGNSYNQTLRKIAKLVKENDGYVTVYGFASSRTRDTDPATHKLANFKVSAERAENTAKALRKAGVPADKISVQALSDTMPLYQEVMPEGERLNRRAEIYLTY